MYILRIRSHWTRQRTLACRAHQLWRSGRFAKWQHCVTAAHMECTQEGERAWDKPWREPGETKEKTEKPGRGAIKEKKTAKDKDKKRRPRRGPRARSKTPDHEKKRDGRSPSPDGGAGGRGLADLLKLKNVKSVLGGKALLIELS